MVAADTLDQVGIVMDFRDLKGALKAVLQEMDHQYLNDLPMFATLNPSAENIAAYIYARLQAQVHTPVKLFEVAVWENENCCAIYSE